MCSSAARADRQRLTGFMRAPPLAEELPAPIVRLPIKHLRTPRLLIFGFAYKSTREWTAGYSGKFSNSLDDVLACCCQSAFKFQAE
jgi:hypothetical protein